MEKLFELLYAVAWAAGGNKPAPNGLLPVVRVSREGTYGDGSRVVYGAEVILANGHRFTETDLGVEAAAFAVLRTIRAYAQERGAAFQAIIDLIEPVIHT